MIVCVCGGVPIYLDASNRRDARLCMWWGAYLPRCLQQNRRDDRLCVWWGAYLPRCLQQKGCRDFEGLGPISSDHRAPALHCSPHHIQQERIRTGD